MALDRGAFIDDRPVGYTVKRVTRLPTSFRDITRNKRVRPMDEFDIKLPGSRLRLKLLIFKDNAALCAFWQKYIHAGELCAATVGVVSSMYQFREPYKGKPYVAVDHVYYAVMGLIAGNITMEVLVHEAGHAAMSFARRKTKAFKARHDELPEEEWCYPLGKLAYQIADALASVGLGPFAPATGTSGTKETSS